MACHLVAFVVQTCLLHVPVQTTLSSTCAYDADTIGEMLSGVRKDSDPNWCLAYVVPAGTGKTFSVTGMDQVAGGLSIVALEVDLHTTPVSHQFEQSRLGNDMIFGTAFTALLALAAHAPLAAPAMSAGQANSFQAVPEALPMPSPRGGASSRRSGRAAAFQPLRWDSKPFSLVRPVLPAAKGNPSNFGVSGSFGRRLCRCLH